MSETTERARAAARRLLAARSEAGEPTDAMCGAMLAIADALAHDPALPEELARCIDAKVAPVDLPAAIEQLHIDDVVLALRCRAGDPAALRRFEQEHIATLRPAIARIDAGATFVDEVCQRVRTKLLVPAGAGKLRHYTGQGDLGTWVRVVAVREAIDARRGRTSDAGDDVLAALPESATGPELGIVKHQYREQFTAAFTSALDGLDPAQRNLLRLHYLHGVGIDELGDLLRVHRSSAARRIAKARRELLSHTRRHLQTRLAISAPELRQLMDVIASRLDLSIERFLGASQPGTQ